MPMNFYVGIVISLKFIRSYFCCSTSIAYCQKSNRDNELKLTMPDRVLENLLSIYFYHLKGLTPSNLRFRLGAGHIVTSSKVIFSSIFSFSASRSLVLMSFK